LKQDDFVKGYFVYDSYHLIPGRNLYFQFGSTGYSKVCIIDQIPSVGMSLNLGNFSFGFNTNTNTNQKNNLNLNTSGKFNTQNNNNKKTNLNFGFQYNNNQNNNTQNNNTYGLQNNNSFVFGNNNNQNNIMQYNNTFGFQNNNTSFGLQNNNTQNNYTFGNNINQNNNTQNNNNYRFQNNNTTFGIQNNNNTFGIQNNNNTFGFLNNNTQNNNTFGLQGTPYTQNLGLSQNLSQSMTFGQNSYTGGTRIILTPQRGFQTYGKRHEDTRSFDHFNIIPTNTPYPIRQIKLYGSNYVHGFQIAYEINLSTPLELGYYNNHKETVLNFETGEFITEISGRAGDVIDFLEIKTNMNRSIRAGGNGGSPFSFTKPYGTQFVGFYGGVGGHLHNIGIIYA